MALNAKQLALVTAPKGTLLCIAGAGTGKTFTLIEKIKYAITTQGIYPSEILAITFTKKAAGEMKARLFSSLGDDGLYVNACTINSFCARDIINYDPLYFGFTKRPVILKEGYITLLKAMFPNEDRDTLKVLAKEIDFNFTRSLPLPATVKVDDTARLAVRSRHSKKFQSLPTKSYDLPFVVDQMRRFQFANNFITFTDQIFFSHERLKEDVIFRHYLSSQFKLVIVDEAQDNNVMQNRIVLYLGEVHRNIIAVGDDAQSIFRFRGANPEFFLDLNRKEDFALYTLTENYRSYQPILDLGNAVLASNFAAKVQIEKHLVAARDSRYAKKPELFTFRDPRMEVFYIGQEVHSYINKGGSPSDIVILCRTIVGGQGRFIQGDLRQRGIPYRVVGGVDIAKSLHTKRMFAVFTLACGYNVQEDVAELLAMFPSIGEAKASTLSQLLPDWPAIIKQAPKVARDGIESLVDLLQRIKAQLNAPAHCYLSFVKWYLALLCEYYDAEDKELSQIETFLSAFGDVLEGDDLAEALENMNLDPEPEVDLATPKVTISTIHQFKGLEKPFVIIPDCHNGMYPHAMAKKEEERQEECRIFHVAVTRAKDRLILTATLAKYGLTHFIDDDLVLQQESSSRIRHVSFM